MRHVVDTYREDLRKLLRLSFADVKLEWSEDFENFLAERKRHRKVGGPRDREVLQKPLQEVPRGERAIGRVRGVRWLDTGRHLVKKT
ncbi:MAG: hypothetical protein QW503_07435 [Sulfolobales archaeon]